MSTQPIERRRVRGIRSRRPAGLRLVTMIVALFAVFGAAFAIGHTRATSAGSGAEQAPPSLPAVPSPVPSSLAAAPQIDVGVASAPPETHVAAPHETSSAPATPPRASAPVTAPAVPTTPAPTPAPTAPPVVPVVRSPPVSAPAPAPTPSSGSSGSGSSSGSGTTFESSE
ncbi:MAG: hypothetical protein ACLQBB_11070 [Solirubrobacteraceae bacterium]